MTFFFCSSVRRRIMPRKKWRAVEAPAGWYEVIRGPRPSSVKWPMAQPLKQVVPKGGRWRGARNATVPSVPPNIAREGARVRVSQLQTAIAAFGGHDCPEVTMLREAMKRAQRAAREPPLQSGRRMRGVHCSSGEAFGLHDEQRSKLVSDLEDGRNLLQQLRAVAQAAKRTPTPVSQAPPYWGAQIWSFQQMVNGGARCIDVCHRPESFQETPGCKITQMLRHCG